MEYKFNIGDKVRVRSDLQPGEIYNDHCMFAYGMEKYRGKESVITGRSNNYGRIRYKLGIDLNRWYWSEDMLEDAATPKKFRPVEMITIVSDGNETRAYYKKKGKVLANSKTIRNDADVHDLKMAARLCVDRLELSKKAEASYYTGRFLFVRNEQTAFTGLTPGYVYEVDDGYIQDINHGVLPSLRRRFENWREIFLEFEGKGVVFEVKGEASKYE